MSTIAENLNEVRKRIELACTKSGRDPKSVTLIAVSKTKPVSMIEEAIAAQAIDFGENRPQELRDKADVLPKELRWHMIGNLQRNKVKYVVGRACMIHSLSSMELAEEIERQAEKHDVIVPCLVEVNMAGEDSKSGIEPADTEAFIREAALFPHIRIKGLMTVAPYTDDPESNRIYFRSMRKLAVDIAQKNIDNVEVCELSMGMTGDYEVAVEEGATFVRVGTGVFGERNYNI